MTLRKESRRSPWSAASRSTTERDEKRLAVLNAAAEAFSSQGYSGTSLDDIARKLGVSKPTIYYYAQNKDELILAINVRAAEQILAARQGDPNASGLDQLRYFLRAYAGVMTTSFGGCLVLLSDFDIGPEAAATIRAGKREIDLHIRDLLALGVADGTIARCDIKMTAFMLAGAINGIGRWYRADRELGPDRIAELFLNQLTAGLAPRT